MPKKPLERVLIDTNVLFEALNTQRQHHTEALDLLETHPHLVMPAQVIREFLVVATRSLAQNGLGLSMRVALDTIAAFRENISLLREEKPILPTFLPLLSKLPCQGSKIHDAHLVAAALAHDVKVISTFNLSDFAAFESLVQVFTPKVVLARL